MAIGYTLNAIEWSLRSTVEEETHTYYKWRVGVPWGLRNAPTRINYRLLAEEVMLH